MYDQETETWWSHILGEAMQGPLKGEKLEQIPSIMTTWEQWLNEHPESTVAVLSKTSRDYRASIYQRNLPGFLLGITSGNSARAWPFDLLVKQQVLNDHWNDRPVVAVIDPKHMTPQLFARTVDDRVLTFRMHPDTGLLIDNETQTAWEPVSGQALDGTLAGRKLDPLPAIVSETDAWQRFHPDSTYAGSSDRRE